jgi:iron complex outermembrane receptor protein
MYVPLEGISMTRKAIRWTTSVSFYLVLLVLAGVQSAQAQTKEFNVPAQSATTGIPEFARQAGIQILVSETLVRGKRTAAVTGPLSVEKALTILLQGTGLTANSKDGTTYTLSQKSAPATTGGSPAPGAGSSAIAESQGVPQAESKTSSSEVKEGLSEIVVTGTSIHNIDPITPTITITGQQMTEQGYSRLDQVFDQLPQNFNGGASQASNGFLGVGSAASTNQFFASGVNLRGLGAGATLVLLNGRRLATTAQGTSVDISSIPISAIDRVEILTDGASAIYGSDAVAGVVNIITKRDYSGVETGVRSTGITEGKTADYGGHILGGYDWGSGNFTMSFDGEKDHALLSTERSFQPPSSAPFDLLPEQERRSFYGSARQELSSRLSVSLDALVSDRTFAQTANCCVGGAGGTYGPESGYAKQLAASLEIDYSIAQDWNLKIAGQFSREKDLNQEFAPAVNPNFTPELQFYDYKTSSVDAAVDGKLLELPGGALKAAFGGQAKRESLFYETVHSNDGVYTPLSPNSSGSRTSEAAFAEVYVPIVGPQNAIPLVRKLNLDFAERFDRYSDFGSTTNPKVSLQWEPIEGTAAHVSYSKSFRAPELYQLGAGIARFGYITPAPNPASPTGTTTTLLLDGSNPNLQPEHADTFSAGVTFKPLFLTGLKVDFSFFHIAYRDRIDRLILDGYFTNVITAADQLGSLVNLNPTLSQVNAALAPIPPSSFLCIGTACAASDVHAIANIGFVNVGVATVQGYDLDARYDWDTGVGRFFVDAAGTLMTENSLQITPVTTPNSLLNQFGDPLRFRAKTNAGWNLAEWSAYGRVNFANAYHNSLDPNCPELPGCGISSWITVDSGVAFTSPKDKTGFGGGLRIAVDVMNLFNRAPPYANRPSSAIPIAYDPLNANPLLRTLSVSVTKQW